MADEVERENSVTNLFNSYKAYIDNEQAIREDIRESLKELDKSSEQVQSILQAIHLKGTNLKDVCGKARQHLDTNVKSQFQSLERKIPKGEYYHYNDIWRHLMQRVAGSCTLIHYLETDELADRVTVADMLGLKTLPKDANLYFDMEDYLQGLLQIGAELSRFAVTSVTNGDYNIPARIGKFMAELNSGFRELNLKNDFLDQFEVDLEEMTQEVPVPLSIPTPTPIPSSASVPQKKKKKTKRGKPSRARRKAKRAALFSPNPNLRAPEGA